MFSSSEAVVQRSSAIKVFLEISQNSLENTSARDSFLMKLFFLMNFIKKESLAQLFSCEFCEISKNNFFYITPPVAASVILKIKFYALYLIVSFTFTIKTVLPTHLSTIRKRWNQKRKVFDKFLFWDSLKNLCVNTKYRNTSTHLNKPFILIFICITTSCREKID